MTKKSLHIQGEGGLPVIAPATDRLPGAPAVSVHEAEDLLAASQVKNNLPPDGLPGGSIPKATSELPNSTTAEEHDSGLPLTDDKVREQAAENARAIIDTVHLRATPIAPDGLPPHTQATNELPATATTAEYGRGLPK